MAKQTQTVGGVRVVFRVFDVNLGVFRRMGSSVKIKGGSRKKGDISISNTFFLNEGGVEVDVASRQKRCNDVKRCTQAEFWFGVSATVDSGGDVHPGGAPDASVNGVKTTAVVSVNGQSHQFVGRS